MSKGNPIIKTRVPRELLREIRAQIIQRNIYTHEMEWDMSGFIVKAMCEKLAHMKRSRRGRPVAYVPLDGSETVTVPGDSDGDVRPDVIVEPHQEDDQCSR